LRCKSGISRVLCTRSVVKLAALAGLIALGIVSAPASAAVPTVALTGITSGASVSGDVWLSANAWDDRGVTQLKWYVDGREVGWDGSSPWGVNWDSTSVADGTHSVFVKAGDADGGWGSSAVLTFTVANTVVAPPTVAGDAYVTWPTSGTTVSGTFNLTAGAPTGVTEVKWYVDGVEAGWDNSAPWQASWNSATVSNGTHTIFARGLRNGSWSTSPSLSFTVKNGDVASAPPPTQPVSSKWRLLVSDDFNGSSVDTSKWTVYGPNWRGNAGYGLRDHRAVSVANGLLTITAQMLNGVLVSGGVRSNISRTYGRYEFRVRTDPDPSQAMTGVVLTWPSSGNWPTDGENNIYETTTYDRKPIKSFIHYSPQNKQYWFHHDGTDGSQWYTFAMEWEPDQIRIYRNGVHVWTVWDTYAIPDNPHQLIMQLDAWKSWVSGSVRLQLDYVRIWERAW
jgi:hypothetical protein